MAILEVIREVVELNMLVYPPFALGSLPHLPKDPSRRRAPAPPACLALSSE